MTNMNEVVILEIEGTPVECNRNLLITNSDYFAVMLTGKFKESFLDRIEIKGVALKAFKIILVLLQDTTYVIEDQDLHIILETACMLQFNSVKNLCESRIQQVLKPSICLKIWQTADMLHLNPLRLKAKCMALEEFACVCDNSDIFTFTLEEICSYLGHIYLNAKHEMLVFETALNWWYDNQEFYVEEDSTHVILQLLNCLDYSKLSDIDIRHMQSYPGIAENEELKVILNHVVDLKVKWVIIHFEDEFIEKQICYAIHLYNCKSREVPEMPCLLLQRDLRENQCPSKKLRYKEPFDKTAVIYDSKARKFKDFFMIGGDKIWDLVGFKLLSYKEVVYLFGGEFLISAGNWNCNLWTYNSFKEKWERKNMLPHKRRHFESVIVDGCIFIVGGTAYFRVIQENMLWYDCEADKWSSLYPLPNLDRFFKCCCLLGQLCIVYLLLKRAYIFNKEDGSWKMVELVLEENVLREMRNFEVFSFSNYLYIKGKYLIKLKYTGHSLVILSQSPLAIIEYEEVDSILCNKVHYTLYKCLDEQYNACYSLEMLDLETEKAEYVFKSKLEGKGGIEADEKLFCPTKGTKLFSVGYFGMVEQDVRVNNPIIQ